MDPSTFIDTLYNEGVIESKSVSVEPLSGGVSSDIWLIDDGKQQIVFKKARPKLDVNDDWYADPARNVSEQDFILYVRGFLPDAVPMLLYRDQVEEYFVMEYVDESYRNWKQELLAGRVDREIAEKAALLIATIHCKSRNCKEAQEMFDSTGHFYDLRLDPYLITTGNRHATLEPYFEKEVIRLAHHREALVHGDFSPKNLMVGVDRLVLLDHEVAWYGDPAFDIAFMLSHLNIKLLLETEAANELQALPDLFWSRYVDEVSVRSPGLDLFDLEVRTSRLLLMLMLARVDGKSPVEYLQMPQKSRIREFVYEWLPQEEPGLSDIHRQWTLNVKEFNT